MMPFFPHILNATPMRARVRNRVWDWLCGCLLGVVVALLAIALRGAVL